MNEKIIGIRPLSRANDKNVPNDNR